MKRELLTSTKGRLSTVAVVAMLMILICSATAFAATEANTGHTNRRPEAHAQKRAAHRVSPDAEKKAAAKKAAAKRAAAKKAAARKAPPKRRFKTYRTWKAPVKRTTTTKAPTAGATSTAAPAVLTSGKATTTSAKSATPAVKTSTSPAKTSTTSGAAPASTTGSGPVATPANGSILWGATTGTQFDGGQQAPWDMNVVSDFEKQDSAGKGMSIIPFYDDFLNCPNDSAGQVDSSCTDESFPLTPFNNIRAHGSIPMLSWGSQTLQDGYAGTANDSNFTLAKVAAGDYDNYITAWAQKAAAWGHPFFLRFNWEMNGNWFPWSVGSNGNTAADYVAAWRHVHDVFVANGATNATWVWCPNSGYASQLAALYPGDAYVDWTCMDSYNFGTDQGNTWMTWDQGAGADYNQITQSIAPSKPMMIGEFNSSNDGGDAASWMTNTLAEIPAKYPDIKAVVLFDASGDGSDFEMENNQSLVSAFSSGINNPVYASNTFGNLGGRAVTAQ